MAAGESAVTAARGLAAASAVPQPVRGAPAVPAAKVETGSAVRQRAETPEMGATVQTAGTAAIAGTAVTSTPTPTPNPLEGRFRPFQSAGLHVKVPAGLSCPSVASAAASSVQTGDVKAPTGYGESSSGSRSGNAASPGC